MLGEEMRGGKRLHQGGGTSLSVVESVSMKGSMMRRIVRNGL